MTAPRTTGKSGAWWRHAREASCFAGIGLLYLVVAVFAEGEPTTALHHAVDLIRLERRLGLFIEPEWSAWIRPHEWLIDISNVVYFWGHAPVFAVFFVVLYLRRGRSAGAARAYPVFRTGFVVSEVIGILTYIAYPVTPPRLLPSDYGVIDTLALRSAINYEEGDLLVNTYAAFPSLHFAWIVLVAVALFRLDRRLSLVAAVIPFVSFSSIVVTGNHYVLDAVGGLVVAAIGLAVGLAFPDERIASLASRLGRVFRPARRPPRSVL